MTDVLSSRSTFLDDAALIERIFAHIDAGTTDMSDDVWHEPVEHYRSPERLDREVALLRRLPIPFCPSAAVADAGASVARDAAGVPIAVVRGHDGVVRAFRNACRHRGTALISDGGCSRSLVCPYHGWVYRLDGALRHVPDEHGFPGLDKSTLGLVEVHAAERGGVVFVSQDAPLDTELLDSVPELVGGDQVFLDSSDVAMDVNWKVFVEGFLEGYHIKATHPQTFLPFGYDNLTVVESHGRFSRVTFPFQRIEALRGVPPAERRIDGRVTTVHHVVPNVIVARLSHHTTLAIVEPVSVDRSRLVSYRLTNRPAGAETADAAARDRDFVQRGTAEDLAVAARVQTGLSSGANTVLQFGRFEGAITNLHRQLRDLLGEA